MASSFADGFDRGWVDELLKVELLTPAHGRDVAKLAQAIEVIPILRVFHVTGMDLFTQRRARVGIGAVIEEQAREGRFRRAAAVVHPGIGL